MSWLIERDRKGAPVRMWWTGVSEPLPWARKHGLDPRVGLPDNDTAA